MSDFDKDDIVNGEFLYQKDDVGSKPPVKGIVWGTNEQGVVLHDPLMPDEEGPIPITHHGIPAEWLTRELPDWMKHKEVSDE